MRVVFLTLFLSSTSFAQNIDGRSLITEPPVSSRCKALLDRRKSKIKMRQRLRALQKRNLELLQKVPENKDSIKSKLVFARTKIENDLRLGELKLQNLEEDIVRKGCPGVVL